MSTITADPQMFRKLFGLSWWQVNFGPILKSGWRGASRLWRFLLDERDTLLPDEQDLTLNPRTAVRIKVIRKQLFLHGRSQEEVAREFPETENQVLLLLVQRAEPQQGMTVNNNPYPYRWLYGVFERLSAESIRSSNRPPVFRKAPDLPDGVDPTVLDDKVGAKLELDRILRWPNDRSRHHLLALLMFCAPELIGAELLHDAIADLRAQAGDTMRPPEECKALLQRWLDRAPPEPLQDNEAAQAHVAFVLFTARPLEELSTWVARHPDALRRGRDRLRKWVCRARADLRELVEEAEPCNEP